MSKAQFFMRNAQAYVLMRKAQFFFTPSLLKLYLLSYMFS